MKVIRFIFKAFIYVFIVALVLVGIAMYMESPGKLTCSRSDVVNLARETMEKSKLLSGSEIDTTFIATTDHADGKPLSCLAKIKPSPGNSLLGDGDHFVTYTVQPSDNGKYIYMNLRLSN